MIIWKQLSSLLQEMQKLSNRKRVYMETKFLDLLEAKEEEEIRQGELNALEQFSRLVGAETTEFGERNFGWLFKSLAGLQSLTPPCSRALDLIANLLRKALRSPLCPFETAGVLSGRKQ